MSEHGNWTVSYNGFKMVVKAHNRESAIAQVKHVVDTGLYRLLDLEQFGIVSVEKEVRGDD